MNAKRALTRLRAPDEAGAEERAWAVVRSAYADHAPVARHAPRWRLAIAPSIALIAAVLALSPAGATVRRWIGHTLATTPRPAPAPALFSLPAKGRLLVSDPSGSWTIAADGHARHVGPWSQASWSPHHLFIAVANRDQLAAVDPHGNVRWTIARPNVRDPSWFAPTGYRIAYLSGSQLRVIAGDGTEDHLLAAAVQPVAPAWRPGYPYQLTYVDLPGRLVTRDGDTGQQLWSVHLPIRPVRLAWSSDGSRLLALGSHEALIYDARGTLVRQVSSGSPIRDGAVSPDGRMLALVRGGVSDQVTIGPLTATKSQPERVLLAGEGLRNLAWSPDGNWLLVSWPVADQWAFVRVVGRPRIVAASRISQQFSSRAAPRGFPRLEGWCCTSIGTAT